VAGLQAQHKVRDSLLAVCNSAVYDSVKVDAVVELITRHAATEQDIKMYSSAIGSNPSRRSKDKLRLLNVEMAKYGKIGETAKCEAAFHRLLQLAEREKSPEYTIRAYLTMARVVRDQGDNDGFQQHMEEIEKALQQEDLPAMENAYYLELCSHARHEGRYDDALRLNDKAIQAIGTSTLERLLSGTLSMRGRIFRHLGQIDSARIYYQKAKDLAIKYRVEDVIPVALNNLGNIGHIQGRYDEAIEYYMQSIEIKERTGNVRGLAIGYHNVAAIKNDIKAYDEAREQFAKSDEYAAKVDFKKLHALNALKIGWSYQMEERYAEALPYHAKALSICQDINHQKGQLDALIGVGVDQTHLGNLEQANTSLLDALALAQESGNKSAECSALVGLSEWYLKLEGSNYTQSARLSDNKIEAMLLRALTLSKEMDYGEKKLLVYEGLSKLYNKTGEHYKQTALLTEYMELKDSLYSDKRSEAITQWETKYATAEKEKEIIQLEADKKLSQLRTKTWQWALGIVTLLLGLLGYFGYKYQKRKNDQRQMEAAERFRSKLSSDLHDDVGTMLSSLAMQSEVMGLTASPDQVEKFEKLSSLSREAMARMRDTVWAIDSRKDNATDLVDRMKDYLSDLYNGGRMKVKFDQQIESDTIKLQPDVRQNLYLIFKEAVNNAAKYSSGDLLTVRFEHSKNYAKLHVHDNGKISNIKTSGTGLSNMKMRAERIKGSFTLNTQSGFDITVAIPLRK